jgi:L-threonylcarbamoyladenylate synthase
VSTILSASNENVKKAAALLRSGRLVGFPTETVYGLGAHGLEEIPILRIFQAKGRPLSDPLILHVPSLDAARPFVVLTPALLAQVESLSAAFWPGPLTLILPASSLVPAGVRAGGPTVGFRVPGHPIALSFLKECGVPVAAPSANRFGHVSPTRAEHVQHDLGAHDVTILDGGACPVGIESTILKCEEGSATVLRRGSITLFEIREALADILRPECVTAVTRTVVHKASAVEQETLEAPGQLLTHYAPDVPTFLVRVADVAAVAAGDNSHTVVVDVGGRLGSLRTGALAYRTSDEGTEAALSFAFDALRWAEGVSGAQRILVPDLMSEPDEKLLALADRFFRSASGRCVLAEHAR